MIEQTTPKLPSIEVEPTEEDKQWASQVVREHAARKETTESAADIRDELIGEMAAILYDLAPPQGQLIIDRLMIRLNAAVQREAHNVDVGGC